MCRKILNINLNRTYHIYKYKPTYQYQCNIRGHNINFYILHCELWRNFVFIAQAIVCCVYMTSYYATSLHAR
jgi:hypothetical protein